MEARGPDAEIGRFLTEILEAEELVRGDAEGALSQPPAVMVCSM